MGIVVITGAGQGLGQATARRVTADGHEVVAVDIDAAKARATAGEVGGSWRQCDVSDRGSVAELASSLDRVDGLVNNAGIWRFSPLLDITPEDAKAVLDVNVLGLLWCTQLLVPLMVAGGGGSIVNLSSAAAWTNSPGVGVYPASKAAVESLTKQIALEFGAQGIRANAVGPGLIVSEGTSANYQGDQKAERAKGVPLGRVGDPTDIADVVAFLLSDDARYVSGQVIYVDGAVTAGAMRR